MGLTCRVGFIQNPVSHILRLFISTQTICSGRKLAQSRVFTDLSCSLALFGLLDILWLLREDMWLSCLSFSSVFIQSSANVCRMSAILMILSQHFQAWRLDVLKQNLQNAWSTWGREPGEVTRRRIYAWAAGADTSIYHNCRSDPCTAACLCTLRVQPYHILLHPSFLSFQKWLCSCTECCKSEVTDFVSTLLVCHID
jgi:hypothetical protein